MTYTTAQEGTSELVCSMYYPKGWPECCQSTLKKKGKACLFYLSVGAEKGLFGDGTVFWVVWIWKMLCKYCFTVLRFQRVMYFRQVLKTIFKVFFQVSKWSVVPNPREVFPCKTQQAMFWEQLYFHFWFNTLKTYIFLKHLPLTDIQTPRSVAIFTTDLQVSQDTIVLRPVEATGWRSRELGGSAHHEVTEVRITRIPHTFILEADWSCYHYKSQMLSYFRFHIN